MGKNSIAKKRKKLLQRFDEVCAEGFAAWRAGNKVKEKRLAEEAGLIVDKLQELDEQEARETR